MTTPPEHNLLIRTPHSTVLTEYTPLPKTDHSYQSEAQLENTLITQLQNQAYEYLPIHTNNDLDDNLTEYISKRKKEELDSIIATENLNPDVTYAFMDDAFINGFINPYGTDLVHMIPRTQSRFSSTNAYAATKERVLLKLENYLERYRGL